MEREIKFLTWSELPKYEVGTNGTVWSKDYNHSGKRGELSQFKDKDGYCYVFLVVDRKRYKRSVHRMVAITFISNPENKPQVNHKDGKRYNNFLHNLEWCTASENALHGYRSNGRKHSAKQKALSKERFSGTSNPKAKVNEAIVLSIRRLRAKGDSLKSIGERHNISVSQVSAIANGKFWQNPELLTP